MSPFRICVQTVLGLQPVVGRITPSTGKYAQILNLSTVEYVMLHGKKKIKSINGIKFSRVTLRLRDDPGLPVLAQCIPRVREETK